MQINKLTEYTSKLNHAATAIVITVTGDQVQYVDTFASVVGTSHTCSATVFRARYNVR